MPQQNQTHRVTDLKNGAPDRIRTCDHPLRRRMLYPAELRAHVSVQRSAQGLPLAPFPVHTIEAQKSKIRFQARPSSTMGYSMNCTSALAPPRVAGVQTLPALRWAT